MAELPPEPVSSREFIEDVVPAIFADFDLGEEEQALDLKLGVCLVAEDTNGDDDGGEWTLHFVEGELGISEGRDDDCALTVVQRLADWRAALWEGRPGLVADAVERVAREGPGSLAPPGLDGAPRNPAALDGLADLQGMIEGTIASEGEADWRLAVVMGPGPIPETPQATIRIGAEQAEAIRRGELHPLEALITGLLRFEGDIGLILQLQAIAMTASMAPPPARS